MKKILFAALAVMALTASAVAAGIQTKTAGPSAGSGANCTPYHHYDQTTVYIGGQATTQMVYLGYYC